MVNEDRPLAGQVAVVTGAASGIGRACAELFAAHGATVAALDRKWAADNKFEAVDGREILVVDADCGIEEDVERAFSLVEKRFGPVTILVNNAGGSDRKEPGGACGASTTLWREMLNQNLMTAVLCTSRVSAAMQNAKRGKIINITTHLAQQGWPKNVPYVVAKGALLTFTRCLARELAASHVNVNAIAPGTIATKALAELPPHYVERGKSLIPMARVGQPEEVAKLALYLASPESDFITGQSIVIDGGVVIS